MKSHLQEQPNESNHYQLLLQAFNLFRFASLLPKLLTGFLLFALGIAVGCTLTSNSNSIPLFFQFPLHTLASPPTPPPQTLPTPPLQPSPTPAPQSPPTPAPQFPPIQLPTLLSLSPPLPAVKGSDNDLNRSDEPNEVMQGMTDDELLRRASMAPKSLSLSQHIVPKVAFLFLTRGSLPFAPLWEKFFQGHGGLYSIYVHSDPSYNDSSPEWSVFHRRRIPSKVVQWGELNMMEAERRLLANALLDPSNLRFVLLSESCIPLFNFPAIYSYLVNATTSFVQVYDDPGSSGRGRYNRRMHSVIPASSWRKGSQWFELRRDLAVEVVADNHFFPVFRRFCHPSCYVDEHYLPTMLSMRFGPLIANRSVTWVDWSHPGAHPARFIRPAVTKGLLQWMRGGAADCKYNGRETKMCFLFARKFHPNSLTRLLWFAPRVMGFGRR